MANSREQRILKRSGRALEELYGIASQNAENEVTFSDGTMVRVTEESIRITLQDGRIALYRREKPDGWRPESVLLPAGRRGIMGAYNLVGEDHRTRIGMQIVFQARRSVNASHSTK